MKKKNIDNVKIVESTKYLYFNGKDPDDIIMHFVEKPSFIDKNVRRANPVISEDYVKINSKCMKVVMH